MNVGMLLHELIDRLLVANLFIRVPERIREIHDAVPARRTWSAAPRKSRQHHHDEQAHRDPCHGSRKESAVSALTPWPRASGTHCLRARGAKTSMPVIESHSCFSFQRIYSCR